MTETWDQTFDEEIADFDSATPAWDGEVDAVADFDAETDADGDLNDHADAAHDGAVGLEITFDDANEASGTMNAGAVNQTTGVWSFWFNKNDVAVEAGRYIYLAIAWDGVGSGSWRVQYHEGSSVNLRLITREDGGGYVTTSGGAEITAGWHKLDVHFARSSGAGADDGWVRLYVDDILYLEETGLDNDTKDWDVVDFGMCNSNSTTFGGSFYLDTIKIDPAGAPMVDTLAAQSGTYGLSIPIMDTTVRYCSFTDPAAETAITAECNFDPNTLTMASGNQFNFMTEPNAYFYTTLNYDGANYRIQAGVHHDTGYTATSYYAISDANHKIRVVWKASSGAGNDDGYLKLYIDDVLLETLSGLDNDTRAISAINFGAVAGLDAGTYGIFYMDDCKWADEVFSDLQIETSAGVSIGAVADGDAVLMLSAGEEWHAFDLSKLV